MYRPLGVAFLGKFVLDIKAAQINVNVIILIFLGAKCIWLYQQNPKIFIFYRLFRISYISNGISNYLLLSENLTIGDRIYCGSILSALNVKSGLKLGSSLLLSYIPLFSLVSNIELRPYKGGQLARAAGTSAMIVTKLEDQITVNLSRVEIYVCKGQICAHLGQYQMRYIDLRGFPKQV